MSVYYSLNLRPLESAHLMARMRLVEAKGPIHSGSSMCFGMP